MLIFVTAVSMALIISFLCSIMESVLLSIGMADIEALARDGKPAGRLLRGFKRHIDAPIAAILILNTVAHTVGATVAGASYETAVDDQSLWLFSIVFTVAVLLFSEIIPKTLGVTYAKELASPVARGIHFLNLALHPFVRLSERVSRALRKQKQEPVTSVDEIRLLANLGVKEGVVGSRTAQIIEGAARLGQLQARDVMVPKGQVTYLTADHTLDDAVEILRKSGHSRVPFSRGGELAQVVGIILVKELFFYVEERAERQIDWNSLLQTLQVIPESQPLTQMLRTFQESRSHMAMVVDEYGSVIGIVTLEDVLEEIVGDIYDESDRKIETMWPRPDGSLDVLATIDMRDVCDYFGTEWPSDVDVKSVSGLVTELLERFPVTGDLVEWSGYQLEVLAVTRTRAQRIRVSPLPPDSSNDPEQHNR